MSTLKPIPGLGPGFYECEVPVAPVASDPREGRVEWNADKTAVIIKREPTDVRAFVELQPLPPAFARQTFTPWSSDDMKAFAVQAINAWQAIAPVASDEIEPGAMGAAIQKIDFPPLPDVWRKETDGWVRLAPVASEPDVEAMCKRVEGARTPTNIFRAEVTTLLRKQAAQLAIQAKILEGYDGLVAINKGQAAQIAELQKALQTIADWSEFPPSGLTWNDGTPMSYAAANGSNGERDYMRSIAMAAIAGKEATPANSETVAP